MFGYFWLARGVTLRLDGFASQRRMYTHEWADQNLTQIYVPATKYTLGK